MKKHFLLASILCSALVGIPAFAADTSAPAGDPVLDPPTLKSLGGYWKITGDDNKNATISLEYRKAGAGEWKKGLPLLRVFQDVKWKKMPPKQLVTVPEGGQLF